MPPITKLLLSEKGWFLTSVVLEQSLKTQLRVQPKTSENRKQKWQKWFGGLGLWAGFKSHNSSYFTSLSRLGNDFQMAQLAVPMLIPQQSSSAFYHDGSHHRLRKHPLANDGTRWANPCLLKRSCKASEGEAFLGAKLSRVGRRQLHTALASFPSGAEIEKEKHHKPLIFSSLPQKRDVFFSKIWWVWHWT